MRKTARPTNKMGKGIVKKSKIVPGFDGSGDNYNDVI
jgi:hypothetical protein